MTSSFFTYSGWVFYTLWLIVHFLYTDQWFSTTEAPACTVDLIRLGRTARNVMGVDFVVRTQRTERFAKRVGRRDHDAHHVSAAAVPWW